MRKIRPKITYANVMVTILAFVVLAGGSALAAGQLGKNSVGSRQLKSKSVTTGKLANNAVRGAKVADGSLTGKDIKLSELGTVPTATAASSAANANTVGGHAAACPPGTTLIRGICFDTASNGPVNSVKEAADACAAVGGYLPTPIELYAARGVLNLGTGVGSDRQFTNAYYSDTSGGAYRTLTVDGTGAIAEHEVEGVPARYTCAYLLVR
jgi:hypothetical protein